MILTYFGHAFFTLTLSDGRIIATDPYQSRNKSLTADICTLSHPRFHRDAANIFQKPPLLLDQPGPYAPLPGICITGIPTFHEDRQGEKPEENLIFVVKTEGLRLVHLGHLRHNLSETQIQSIGKPDVLFLPVGGRYNLDCKMAQKVIESLAPKVTIPMHYRTHACESVPITPLGEFFRRLSIHPTPMPLCRITRQDISECPKVVLLTTAEDF